MRADKQNAGCLKNILDTYCRSSGQMLSVNKSSIFFSGNTLPETEVEVNNSLNILNESLNDKYLGLSALVGADKSDCFRHLIDRIRLRINGWKEKQLNIGGKEVLVKSIAQAIPMFAMLVFKILKKYMQRDDGCYLAILVGDDNEKKRIHW